MSKPTVMYSFCNPALAYNNMDSIYMLALLVFVMHVNIMFSFLSIFSEPNMTLPRSSSTAADR